MRKTKKSFAFLLALVMVISVFTNTGLAMKAQAAENTVTVFYKNSSWSNTPYIHYKVGTKWTTSPGKKMTASEEQTGYKYKYVIALGSEKKAVVCFNNGKGKWDNLNSKNYTVRTGVYGIKNQKITELSATATVAPTATATVEPTATATVEPTATATVEPTATVTVEPTATATVAPIVTSTPSPTDNEFGVRRVEIVEGRPSTYVNVFLSGVANDEFCTVDFETVNKETKENVYSDSIDYKNDDECFSLWIEDAGEYTLHLKFTAPNGSTCEVTRDFTVPNFSIDQIRATCEKPVVGTKVTLMANLENAREFYHPTSTCWTIKKDGKTVVDGEWASCSYSFDWVPAEAGTYEITVSATDFGYASAKCTRSIEVAKKKNLAIIYYTNSSFSNANVHYKVGNSTWTKSPGKAMKATYSVNGKWMYKIDLGTEKTATVCFNDGKKWDNNGSKNYSVSAGVTIVTPGSSKKAEMTIEPKEKADTIEKRYYNYITNTIKGGVAPYSVYEVFSCNGNTCITYTTAECDVISENYNIMKSGYYSIQRVITDSTGQVVKFYDSYIVPELEISNVKKSAAVGTVGEMVTFEAELAHAYIYRGYTPSYWVIKKNGQVVTDEYVQGSATFEWTPQEAGTYEVEVTAYDSASDKAQTTFTFEVKAKAEKNVAIVYYNNSNFIKTNIHYKVAGGTWTEAPGVEMKASDHSNYTWMYEIDLGDATDAIVCFNNGNGYWDSNYGKNYSVHAGKNAIIERKYYYLGE